MGIREVARREPGHHGSRIDLVARHPPAICRPSSCHCLQSATYLGELEARTRFVGTNRLPLPLPAYGLSQGGGQDACRQAPPRTRAWHVPKLVLPSSPLRG